MRRGCLWFGAVFAVVALILSTSGSAFAATDAAQGLQISPVVINLNADKDKTYDLKISLLNVTTGSLVYNSYVNDFKSKDETGDPDILLNSTLPPTASIVSWVQPIGSIALNSGETKDLDVSLTVPANAESGGHYGVIRFSGTAPNQQQTGVALAASAGVLLLVRVSGNITENLRVVDFFAERGSARTSWFANGPVTFVERINNTGNVHVAPTGDLTVSNMFGKNVATLKVNQTAGNILPASIRRFEQTLQKKWLFGRYTASVNLAYGTEGKVIAGTMSFWVIPWIQILIGIGLLVVFILLLRWIIRRYNKWIINKSDPRNPSSSTPHKPIQTSQSHQNKPPAKRPPRPPMVQ